MPCGLPTRRYFQGIWCLECPAGCQPADTFKAFGAWNALRRHLYFQGIWCLECLTDCQSAGTFKAFGAWNALRLPTRRYFQGIWCLECHAGCQSADTFKAFGAWNALRAANPQVLSRLLVLEMPCGLPTRRYFQGIWCLKCPAGCQPAGTFKAFGAWNALRAAKPQVLSRHLVLGMPCGLPTRRYFQDVWCLKCPAGCQTAGTFKAFGAWNALRAVNPQVLSRHLMLEMPCGLPTRRYFQGIWCLKCLAGCHNLQVLSRHLVLEMPCGLPARKYFQGIRCLKYPAGCHPAGTFKAFGA